MNANYYIASCSGPDNRANKRFIAAANPATVLAVLDEREAQSKRIAELETNLAALAAENAGLNKFIAQSCYVFDGEQDELSDAYICAIDGRMPQTPATDAFLAEVRAKARNEGINYTASRLAAAFNHGFINKSLREVFDVTRMILSAKEELANEPHPIDGLSGEYAEKSLEEWVEQIRKGDNQ
ncbi:Eae protein [Escherichia coli]|nr:Eae protein [Escherichia coli]AOM62942.1 Eae protein [Escherichia coli]